MEYFTHCGTSHNGIFEDSPVVYAGKKHKVELCPAGTMDAIEPAGGGAKNGELIRRQLS
jgi:hypothetical protein